MPSIFTKIINKEIPCYKITEEENFFSFLDINPLAKGHALVIPKKEIDYIFDMDNAMYQELFVFAKRIAKAIKKTIRCERIGIVVAGLEVPHVHIHLIPIDTITDMDFSNPRVKLSDEVFFKIASEITANLE